MSVDCLGHVSTLSSSILGLRALGRHVQIGLFPSAKADLPISRVIRDELEVLGVHGLSSTRLAEVFALVTSGRLVLAPMVTRTISLDDLPEALPAMGGFTIPGVSVVTSGFTVN